MNEYITIIAIVLFGLGVVLELLATRIPDRKITGDFSKLICSGQYEMAVRYMMASNKKKLARELKWIMKDAEKKDRKGVKINYAGGMTQKNRFRFAYELYLLFVGDLKVKKEFLEQCELSKEHMYDIEHLKACIRD
jgi:hypothetical protein